MNNPFAAGNLEQIEVNERLASTPRGSTITYHPDIDQGSESWLKLRCGLLTASEMKLIITAPPKEETRVKKNGELYKQREWIVAADDDQCRKHLYELLAQRITHYVEPHYFSDDMLRGQEDEILARAAYDKRYAPVKNMGFITNDRWGFTLGYSPDGLVGDDGAIECKSRRQKYQVQTIVECVGTDTIMPEYVMQAQTGLLVSERQWVDHISYSGGLPMAVVRVWPDEKVQNAIVEAAGAFEDRLMKAWETFNSVVADRALVATERRIEQEIF